MRWIAILLVVCLVFAGCSGKGKDKDGSDTGTSTTGTRTGSGTGTGTSTGTGGPAVGTITAAFARTTPNGAVPLGVNFTLNATFSKVGSAATPAGMSWTINVTASDNGTAPASLNGTALPAEFTLNFTAAGNYSVRAVVSAPDYRSANATILISASVAGPSTPIFFDGGEGDASQWTIATEVYESFAADDYEPVPPSAMANYPYKWRIDTVEKNTGAKSWWPTYPDEHRMHMTSVAIALPGASHTLSFMIKGGAENNSAGAKDGLHVFAGPDGGTLVEVAYKTGAIDAWTQVVVPLDLTGPIRLKFSFWSDLGCSATNYPDPVAGQALCGPGNDKGIWVDDITVI